MKGHIEFELENMEEVEENLYVIRINGTLILVMDENENIGLSASGKMQGIAQSGGFVSLGKGVKANVYVGKRV